MCSLFAATYPERTRALDHDRHVRQAAVGARLPVGARRRGARAFCDEIRDALGRAGRHRGARAEPCAHDPAFRDWWAPTCGMGASPGAALALTRMNAEIDVRDVLPSIRVPTLVLHRTGDRCLLVEEGRYVASRDPRRARSSSCPARTTCRSSATRTRSSTRSSAFLGLGARRPSMPTACWRRSSARAIERATGRRRGAAGLRRPRRRDVDWFRGRGLAFTPTARSWPRSTVRRGRSAAPRRWPRRGAALGCARCGPACTPASASRRRRDAGRRRRPVGATWRRSPGPARSSVSRTLVDLVAGSGLGSSRAARSRSAPTATASRSSRSAVPGGLILYRTLPPPLRIAAAGA